VKKSKRLVLLSGLLILLVGILFTAFQVHAQRTGKRLQRKAALAQANVASWVRQGRDPSAVLLILSQVKPELDAGDPQVAEALLDRALHMLAAEPLPVPSEQPSELYGNPAPVSIDGYKGSAMEPFLSPDGHFLFFNNENDPRVNTNLHFAERTGKLSFHYLGELPGVNSPVLDAVASLDTGGHFYFTSVRDFDRTRNSLFVGDFTGKAVTNVHPVPGNINPTTPATINMDAGISPDGQALYISRAVIWPGATAPAKSELLIARLKNGMFQLDPDSDRILNKVNKNGLNYAPAISADGRELYFTRANPDRVRIMVATRASTSQPFNEPRRLTALTGFVEAPTVSLDEKEMFFHKKQGEKFVIYRAERLSK
jgi:Tol biopolymer transport system component